MKILEDIYKDNIIQKRVRHSNTISPKLLSVILEEFFKNLELEETGIQINGRYLNIPRFADDRYFETLSDFAFCSVESFYHTTPIMQCV